MHWILSWSVLLTLPHRYHPQTLLLYQTFSRLILLRVPEVLSLYPILVLRFVLPAAVLLIYHHRLYGTLGSHLLNYFPMCSISEWSLLPQSLLPQSLLPQSLLPQSLLPQSLLPQSLQKNHCRYLRLPDEY